MRDLSTQHEGICFDKQNQVQLLYEQDSRQRLTWSALYHMPRKTPARFRHPESGANIWELGPGCVLLRTGPHDTASAALEDLSRIVRAEEMRRVR